MFQRKATAGQPPATPARTGPSNGAGAHGPAANGSPHAVRQREISFPQNRRLGEVLLASGVVTAEQLGEALEEQKRSGERLGAVLVRGGLITEDQLVLVLSQLYGIPAVAIPQPTPELEIVHLVPAPIARKHQVLAIERTDHTLTLAMADPTNVAALDDVAFVTGLKVVAAIAAPSAIRETLERAYEPVRSSLADVLTEVEGDIELLDGSAQLDRPGSLSLVELRAEADQAPVVRLVNSLLLDAVRRRASDVHLEPYELGLRVRFRVDGMLQEVMVPPKRLEAAIVSRIKIISNLDIAERRLPQDGAFKFRFKNRDIDLRVSVLPTIFGEDVCMRVLDREALKLDISELGLDPWGLEHFRNAIQGPNGIVLITGPSGAGKSTTLYSALHTLNSPEVNIMTVEDPVEYNMMGIRQVQVKEDIGRTFPAVLRSLLRHDPDVIMVGEMRDEETAQIAIRAALTGHLVLSTLHTNDAPSTVSRLLDMGLPPFLISSALNLIIAQRLVRRICPVCREAFETDEDTLTPYGYTPQGIRPLVLYRSKGCPSCSFSGMRGRVAVHEVMPMTQEIREMVVRGASVNEIREAAVRAGMKTLRQSGFARMIEGLTTLAEVLRVTAD